MIEEFQRTFPRLLLQKKKIKFYFDRRINLNIFFSYLKWVIFTGGTKINDFWNRSRKKRLRTNWQAKVTKYFEKMFFQNSVRPQLLLAIVSIIFQFQIGNCQNLENEEKQKFAASLCGCHELQSLQEIRYNFKEICFIIKKYFYMFPLKTDCFSKEFVVRVSELRKM